MTNLRNPLFSGRNLAKKATEAQKMANIKQKSQVLVPNCLSGYDIVDQDKAGLAGIMVFHPEIQKPSWMSVSEFEKQGHPAGPCWLVYDGEVILAHHERGIPETFPPLGVSIFQASEGSHRIFDYSLIAYVMPIEKPEAPSCTA